MTTQPNQALAEREQTGLSFGVISQMTGYELPDLAMIRHNMASTLRVSPDQVPLYDLALFAKACRTLGLDPLTRQAYWISRQGKGALQVSIDGYRAIADRTNSYVGSSEPVFRAHIEWTHRGEVLIVPEYCQVIVRKVVAGHVGSFVGEARWVEYVPRVNNAGVESDMWAKMPRNQLAKCAEAQALRKAFPAQLGQVVMSADQDEIGDEAHTRIVIEQEPARPKPTYDQVFADPGLEQASAKATADAKRDRDPVASVDDAGPLPEFEPEPEVHPNQDVLTENQRLLHAAYDLRIGGLNKLQANTGWSRSAIDQANHELSERIQARNGDAATSKQQAGML